MNILKKILCEFIKIVLVFVATIVICIGVIELVNYFNALGVGGSSAGMSLDFIKENLL